MGDLRNKGCRECGGDFFLTHMDVAAHLSEVVDGAIQDAPPGAPHDALWGAFCRLVAAVDMSVAQLEGLCGACCRKRLTALDTERAARRAAGGAA